MIPAGVFQRAQADHLDALGQVSEICQRGAVFEAAIAQRLHILAALDRAQAAAAGQRAGADLHQRVGQGDAFERRAIAQRAVRQDADIFEVDRLEDSAADRAAHLQHIVRQNKALRPADPEPVQGLVALWDGEISDLIAAGETALRQNRRLRKLDLGQAGHSVDVNVIYALRDGQLGDATVFRTGILNREGFQSVGKHQLVYAL